MDKQSLLQRCHVLAGSASAGEATVTPWQPDDAIGFLQSLRPSGRGLPDLFAGVPHGPELLERLRQVFAAAGDSRRPGGGHDAYFIVRKPAAIATQPVQDAGRQWLENLAELDRRIGSGAAAECIAAGPHVRVLEGQPPKHPRDPAERCELLRAIMSFPAAHLEPLEPPGGAALGLARAYYFIACDAYLRDHLLWPVYRDVVGMSDPFAPYFVLWRHGIKYRIFNNETVDLYIPRHTGVLSS